MTEHVEHWEWPTGETMALQVASVHEIREGKIIRWWDYWDMNVLTAAAPTVVVRTRPPGLEVDLLAFARTRNSPTTALQVPPSRADTTVVGVRPGGWGNVREALGFRVRSGGDRAS